MLNVFQAQTVLIKHTNFRIKFPNSSYKFRIQEGSHEMDV